MNDDDSLSSLLKTWRHQPLEAPDFNRSVWSRLQAEPANTATAPRLFDQLLAFPGATARWTMPLAASFVLLLSLATGSGVALAYDSMTRDDRMAAEYARSIDPLQMAMQPQTSHSHP